MDFNSTLGGSFGGAFPADSAPPPPQSPSVTTTTTTNKWQPGSKEHLKARITRGAGAISGTVNRAASRILIGTRGASTGHGGVGASTVQTRQSKKTRGFGGLRKLWGGSRQSRSKGNDPAVTTLGTVNAKTVRRAHKTGDVQLMRDGIVGQQQNMIARQLLKGSSDIPSLEQGLRDIDTFIEDACNDDQNTRDDAIATLGDKLPKALGNNGENIGRAVGSPMQTMGTSAGLYASSRLGPSLKGLVELRRGAIQQGRVVEFDQALAAKLPKQMLGETSIMHKDLDTWTQELQQELGLH